MNIDFGNKKIFIDGKEMPLDLIIIHPHCGDHNSGIFQHIFT